MGGQSTGGPNSLDAPDPGDDPGRPGLTLTDLDVEEPIETEYAEDILNLSAGDRAVEAGAETGYRGGDDTAAGVGGAEEWNPAPDGPIGETRVPGDAGADASPGRLGNAPRSQHPRPSTPEKK